MKTFQIGDFAVTEFVDVEVYNRSDGLLDYRLEDLQDFTLNSTQEETDITGRGGRVIGKKKKNKALSGSGTSGLISPGLMRTQTGGEIKYGEFNVKRAEAKVVKGKTITTDAAAVGTEGAEIGEIKFFGAGGVLKAVLEQGSTTDGGKFTYDSQSKTITLPDDASEVEDGMSAVYAYMRKVNATRVNDPVDRFSQTKEMWVHCFGKDLCDNMYSADIYIPRADFEGNFELDLGGDQTTHNFSFNALPDFCNTEGDNDLFELYIHSEDTGAVFP